MAHLTNCDTRGGWMAFEDYVEDLWRNNTALAPSLSLSGLVHSLQVMATSSQASGSSAKPLQAQMTASGIPQAPFIEDVEKHLGGPEEDAGPHLEKFSEAMQKYKVMEEKTFRRRQAMEEKIPDIKKTLAMVKQLQAYKEQRKTMSTHFELADTLFAHASIEPVEEVNLWLGANVMLAYPLEEAVALLTANLLGAEKSLENILGDLDFLRDQITTMEVNTARVHNWDVKRRRELRLRSEQQGAGTKS
ncbi:Molecular chaperone Prefoldin, subunit 3 [Ceraceosorus bombacis]|uniref:Molecular chaperone Prefoldin, subunit 3 n=1 Tax=Ceraceosorus bombacis TaxID=401625 RepID=A0A0P1BBX3_9BASI|nr:Molecular chaperone Prefoldin, subunit 3 [Ceraceosorus bombacis]